MPQAAGSAPAGFAITPSDENARRDTVTTSPFAEKFAAVLPYAADGRGD